MFFLSILDLVLTYLLKHEPRESAPRHVWLVKLEGGGPRTSDFRERSGAVVREKDVSVPVLENGIKKRQHQQFFLTILIQLFSQSTTE